jgi:hypothetical protein
MKRRYAELLFAAALTLGAGMAHGADIRIAQGRSPAAGKRQGWKA